MADNVTPFRRPPKRAPAPQQSGGLGFKTHRGKALLSQGLTLAAFAINAAQLFNWPTNFGVLGWVVAMAVGIGAAVIAYSNRGQGTPWANTHHEHALRTLILGYCIWILASMLTYVHGALAVATLFIHVAVAIWAALRSGIGFVFAGMRKAIPQPRGWLI